MDKETLIREIHNVLSIDAPFFYRIKRLLNEYQALSIVSDTQELCLLARLQTELELLLIGENRFADPPAKPKIQIALNYVLQKKQSLLMPIEKKIHFVWIGVLGSFQIAYMKTWAYYNPDYEIQLWHDPQALLCGILRQKIKLYAGTLQGIGNNIDVESTASIHVRAIIDLQNEFYNDYFLPGISQQRTFDDCATQFLLAKGWSTLDELEQIKSTHAYSFNQAIDALKIAQGRATQAQSKMPIRLIEINAALFQTPAKKDYYHYYLKELGLRQNAASASDKARYMILYKEGGIYLDVDLLPHPDNRLWQKIKTDLFDNINKRKIINDYYPQNEFSYMRGVFWFYLTDVLESIFTGKTLALEENTYHRKAYVEMMLMNSLLRACNDDSLLPLPDYQQLALDINQGNQDPFFKTVQLLSTEISHIIEALPKDSLMIPLGELRVLPDGIGYIKHPYVEGEITNSCLFAPKDSPAMLEILNIVLQRDIKIELQQIDRLDVFHPPSPSSDKYSTLDVNLMMYRYDGWIEGAVTTVHSSGPKIIVTWLAEYKKRFDASHPELAVYFEFFRQQLFVFTNISENTEENVKSTWIGSAIMDRDHYYEKPSRYQNQLILQFDNQPSTEAAAHWLYNKRKEISVWVKIISSGYQERIIINGTIPQGFQFYDNQADKKARILLIGQGYNKQLSGLSGEETAQKIINVLASQVLATGINRNPILGDQTMDVISRISVVASDIEPARSHSSSSGREISSFSRGFTYQLLAHLRRSHIEIYEGVSVCDAIIGVDVVGRKWVGSWDLLSEKILWRSSQAAHKWVGVLTPSGNEVRFRKTPLEKDILTQIRPWVDINKHGRFGLFSVYAFSDGFIPAQMSDSFSEMDLIHLADQFDNLAGHRILMADVSVLFSGMKRKAFSGGTKIRTAIVDDRADQLRILRDILRQVIFNEKPGQWLAWLASSNLVMEKTQQRLQTLLIDHPEYYASLKTSVDEDLFDFYYMDLAQKNAYYPIINYLGSEAENIKVVYLGQMEKRLSILFKKTVSDMPITDSSLEYFKENVLKLSGDHTLLIYYTQQNISKKSIGTEVFQSDLRNIASELTPITGRKKIIPLAESYLDSALIFENLTKEIALLGRAVPEDSLILLQKVTQINGQNTFKVPFLNPKTGVLTEIETEQIIFKQARDFLEKSYHIPFSNEDNLALAIQHYHHRMALNLSSWLFNKIFVARFLIEQLKSGKGLFAVPDTYGLPNRFGQSLALQHYVGVAGMASDLLDDVARLSYFTLSKVVSVQAVAFSLHRIAYFSAELLSGATETSRYAFLVKGLLQKDHIQHVMKKLVNGISKTFMGVGLILSATDIVLTTSAFLNAPNSDAKMLLGIQLGFSVMGFSLQLFAIGAALIGATSLALALGASVLVVAVMGVMIIFLLEYFRQKTNTLKASPLFFTNLTQSWKQGYVLKQGCFIHEGPACITLLELGILGSAFRITFGKQRYQAYGSSFIGGVQSELRKLNVLKPFRRADVSITELPPNSKQDDSLRHNLVLPCVAQTDYDFSYGSGVDKIEGYGSNEIFSPLRELEKENQDFVFFHKRHLVDVQRGRVRSIYYEMQEIIPTRRSTNIRVVISQNQVTQNQWALHFPWTETKKDYSREYAIFKKENPDWEKFGSGYEQFKEKITATEQAFRQDIIDNASEITYQMDNASNLRQILVLPPVAFPLKLHLQGGDWLVSALTLGVITPPSRKNTQLQISGHEINLMLIANESIQVQCLIHEKVTLIQHITASEMDIASIVFDASESHANNLKTELDLLYQQQIKTLPGVDRLSSLLIKNYQEETYQGNAHYSIKNKAILWVPAFAIFKFSIACTQLLTIEAEKAFFYAHIDLDTQANGELKNGEPPFQPTFWITHSRSSLLEFINYSFFPLFSASNGLKTRVKIMQEGKQLTLVEHFQKGTSSVAVHYAINITPTASSPLLLRKIQCSSDIFSMLVQDELFVGARSLQTTIKQLRGLLSTLLLDIYLLDDYPANVDLWNEKSPAGEIYADEIIQITDNENTDEYWWSQSCGILAPITLRAGEQEKIKPIWSGKTDYQRVSFWMSVSNENEESMQKLYIKRDTEPYINYNKLGSLKHVGHTPERLYTEDSQENVYAIDVAGRAYLSTIGSKWLTKHRDDLPAAFTALLAINDNEADERFHLPVLSVEGFSCGVSTDNTKSLQAWYETKLKRFYFCYSSHGQKLHYLAHDTQEKAAFWDPHNKTLLYISSLSLDEVQTFNPVIPENILPAVEIVLYGVQKAWKNEELLYLKIHQLIFFSDFNQSPYHFSLQDITEEYFSPYLLSYQLARALEKEFYRIFSDENRVYSGDHYAIWQTHIPYIPLGVQDLFAINFTERKTQIRKMLIEKIVKRTPDDLSVTPKNMWTFLAAHLAQFLPKARLHVGDINNMISEAFTRIRKNGAANIELKQKKLLQFSQYGWYDRQLSALFMIPKKRDKQVDYQYLGLSRDGYHSYVSAEEKKVYKISALKKWEMVQGWPAESQEVADLLCIKRFGDELIYIEKGSTLSGLQKNLPFSAYFLTDIKGIKTLYPRRKSATLLIQLQHWSAITFVIQAHNRALEEDVELIIENEDLGSYKVQREEQDLWISHTQRKFALCISNALNAESVPEDIDLKIINESITMTLPLNQLIEKYNHRANQPEAFYGEVFYPLYTLSDLLTSSA